MPSILIKTIVINPILEREWRVRWRDGRALWIVGALALLVNGWALFNLSRPFAPNESLTTRSHALFANLMVLQTLLALLIAPALTATSIALERERGLLEALQLTSLQPRQIVLGKWFGALLFALLLWLLPLPIIALFFAFGGIEMGEWQGAVQLQGAALCAGAAIGICVSAWSSRAAIALRISYGITLFWGLSGFVALISLRWPRWNPLLREALTAFVQINPPLVALSLSDAFLKSSLQLAARRFGFSEIEICVIFALLFAATLLFFAAIALRRPLEAAVWWEIKPLKSRAKIKTASKISTIPTANSASNLALREAATPSFVERLTNFSNPVLRHETRGKLRMRQPPKAVIVIELLMALGVLAIYFSLLFAAWWQPTGSGLSRFLGGAGGFELGLRETVWRVLPWVAFLVLVPSGALLGATTIVRERESGAWQALTLSSLTPGEILRGKIGGALWICAVFALPLWPLLLPGVQALEYQKFLGDVNNPRNGVPLTLALGEISILVATVFGATTLGMCLAWSSRRSDIAGARVLAVLVLLLGGVPLFAARAESLHLALWHPGWVLWALEQQYRTEPLANLVAPVVVLWTILGFVCWFASWWRLKREMRWRRIRIALISGHSEPRA